MFILFMTFNEHLTSKYGLENRNVKISNLRETNLQTENYLENYQQFVSNP